jgi:hypothetical protein
MTADPESYFPRDYRQARRAFIAATQARGIDVISRVHPSARGPDGKPLFLDTAALGPRNAAHALLLISGMNGREGRFGSGVQTGLLRVGLAPPAGARIVLVHAFDPYGFAWDRLPEADKSGSAHLGWSLAMLEAILAEDLRQVRRLAAVDLQAGSGEPGGEVCAACAVLERTVASWGDGREMTFTMLTTRTLAPGPWRQAYRQSRDAVLAALMTL